MCTSDTISKARTDAKSLKSDKRYKDAPRYPAIYGYEDDFKDSFEAMTGQMARDMIKLLHGFTKTDIKKGEESEELQPSHPNYDKALQIFQDWRNGKIKISDIDKLIQYTGTICGLAPCSVERFIMRKLNELQ